MQVSDSGRAVKGGFHGLYPSLVIEGERKPEFHPQYDKDSRRESAIDFATILRLTGGRLGVHDTPCPLCGPLKSNPRSQNARKLRIWYEKPSFAGFYCPRCDIGGCAVDGDAQRRPNDAAKIAELKRKAAKDRAEYVACQVAKARYLLAASVPIRGTISERYLREVRGIRCDTPTLRHLHPRRPNHHPAMIAAYGLDEPQAAHLTLLKPDGSAKIEAEDGASKITIGSPRRNPIVIQPPNDGLGLLIGEGIETVCSGGEATGLGAWAAGCAGFLPALAESVPRYIEAVTIAAEADPAGQRGAAELARALIARGFDVFVTEAARG